MQCSAVLTSTLLCFTLHISHILCHLKDMGENTRNWTNLLKKLEKRIIGGETTTKKLYPYYVQIFNYGSLCGGTIITSKTVLTAAHCFDQNKNLAEMQIFANPRFLFDLQAISHQVWDFVIHQSYGNPSLFANDIAIVLIHDEFKFSSWVQKAILVNTSMWMKENLTFTVTGWGETQYGEGLVNRDFKWTHLKYISKTKCMAENHIKLGPEMFCLHGDGKRDSCRGDSGGGVLWNGVIVGIVSHGRSCARTPSMYVNVYYFRSWISENVREVYRKYCKFHNKKKSFNYAIFYLLKRQYITIYSATFLCMFTIWSTTAKMIPRLFPKICKKII